MEAVEFTRDRMLEYMSSPKQFDCTLQIRYPLIVSKSYGSEKRFFVPAPSISLEGEGWKNKLANLADFYVSEAKKLKLKLPPQIPDPTIRGSISVHDVSGEHPTLSFELDAEGHSSFVAKSLYIRSTENRNYVQMNVDLKYNSGCSLGTLLTGRMKVISKASKAKHSTNSIDFKYLGISNGQTIVLSNRPKAPPVTKFVVVEGDEFSVSPSRWDPLVIYRVDTLNSPDDDLKFCVKDGPIAYGDVVRLVHKSTGMALPRMRICKSNKDKVVLPEENPGKSNREPVNQLQKIVLQMVNDEYFTFMHLAQGGIVSKTVANIESEKEKTRELTVGDTAMFNICCTDEIRYTFYEAMGHTMQHIVPAPQCLGMSTNVYNAESAADTRPSNQLIGFISGKNFTDDLSVWVGALKCQSDFRGTESIEFVIPDVQTVVADKEMLQYCKIESNGIEVPVFLVRDDGVIFPADLSFSYLNVKLDDDQLNSKNGQGDIEDDQGGAELL